MRKRSDTPKSPPASSTVGLRSSTRASTAARRGEERSTPAAGKEQVKTTSTVSKEADEVVSVTTSGTLFTNNKRSNAKRETAVADDAVKSGTSIPAANDPAVPEALLDNQDIASTETNKEGIEGIGTHPSIPLPETVVSTTDEGPVQSCPEALKVDTELVTAGLTRTMEDDPRPIEAGITSTGLTEVVVSSRQEQEKAANAPTAVELAAKDQDMSAKAPASDAETGKLAQDRVENSSIIGAEARAFLSGQQEEQDKAAEAPAAVELAANNQDRSAKDLASGAKAEKLAQDGAEKSPVIGAEAGTFLSGAEQAEAAKTPAGLEVAANDQDRAAKAPASGAEAGELVQHRVENSPVIGAEAGALPGKHQEEVIKAPELSTEARESSEQEGERALAPGREELSSMVDKEITPLKEGSVSLSEAKGMDEAQHTLRSSPGNKEQVARGNAAASESRMELPSAASTVGMFAGTRPQEGGVISNATAHAFSGKTFNFLLALEAAKTIDRGPIPAKDTSSHFRNNFVSSVEGETVLIVENLGLSSQTPAKLGAMGEVNGVQNEAGKNAVFPVGKDLVGLTFKKRFGKKFFIGKVIEYESEPDWYKVKYEDGDEEELDLMEVHRLLYSDDAEDDERPAPSKRKHGQINTVPDSQKRNASKIKRSGSPGLASSEDHIEGSTQVQERVKLRGYKNRLVIDTSNDRNVGSSNSDSRLSTSSGESLDADDDDDDDDPIFGKKRKSKSKKKPSTQGKKRKQANYSTKTEEGKETTALQSRLSSKLKEESVSKGQDTPTEHRIATRRSTGVPSTHMTSSDDHSSVSLKKPQGNGKEKSRPESPVSEVSPLGGGAKLIGRKTKKDFGGQFYIGEIVHYDNRVKYYKVRYEDGDEEELEWGELAPTLLPQEGNNQVLTLEAPREATSKQSSQVKVKEPSKKGGSATKSKEGAIVPYDRGGSNGDLAIPKRKHRKKIRTASVSVMMKGTDNSQAASTSAAAAASEPPPRALAAARFASASDADVFEYYAWGEAVNFDRSKCPELRATRLLPTSSLVVHLAVSRHHLVVLTAAGQVWIWRSKHGGVHTRCNEWEHVAFLDNRNVILVDISGPDVDRASAGYEPLQEDQVPDPFYLAAVCSNGEDIILQGSQPHEPVHTYQYDNEPQYPDLRDAIMLSNPGWTEDIGRIVQVSVGMVEAADESPFVGYITDMDFVLIRSATRDYMEEVNHVTGYTGKPVKIQCGRVYHAIIMTDDGRAWTWGQGYYPGSNLLSAGFAGKSTSPFSVCQPAVGTLVGRKVVDVGCYGEDFIALTNDGDVHQWTHALPNPASGVYNVPATPVYGQGPSIASGDKLKQVAIGAGICAGISESGKVHTWRTSLKGGFVGSVGLERDASTPLARDEGYTETAILSLGTRAATRVMCVAGSLLVVVKRKYRGRRGGRKKPDPSEKDGKAPEDEDMAED